jgi:hypothetical protein
MLKYEKLRCGKLKFVENAWVTGYFRSNGTGKHRNHNIQWDWENPVNPMKFRILGERMNRP